MEPVYNISQSDSSVSNDSDLDITTYPWVDPSLIPRLDPSNFEFRATLVPSPLLEVNEIEGEHPPNFEEEKLHQNVEGHYSKKLIHAKKEENTQEQVSCLEKLSQIYLEKNDLAKSAILLNCAIAILEKGPVVNKEVKKHLLANLSEIEGLFLKSKGIKNINPNRRSISEYRTWLKNIRFLRIREYHEKKTPIQEVFRTLTNSYKGLLSALIVESQEWLGPAPTKWACIGMGSMARDEMCLYSDLEFAFLLEEKTEASLTYFKNLSELLALRIINFGETKFSLFGQLDYLTLSQKSPTPSGFCMDSGGNTPLGKPGQCELIDTPEGLASFQCSNWMRDDIIVTNALSTVTYIAGARDLVSNYHQAKKERFGKTEEPSEVPFCKKLAFKLLKGDMDDFKPDLYSKEKEETNAFGIKKNLYRPIQSFLSSLKLFCGLESHSSFEIIQELCGKGILSPKGAENLSKALAQILSFRFEAHAFYKNEEEFLLRIEEGKPQEDHFLYLDKEHLNILVEIYTVLIPLHRCTEEFLATKDLKVLSEALFYDDSPQAQGEAFTETLQFEKAETLFQLAITQNPNNIATLYYLAIVRMKEGKYQESLEMSLKAFSLVEQQAQENCSISFVLIPFLIAKNYSMQDQWQKSIEFFKLTLEIIEILRQMPEELLMSKVRCLIQMSEVYTLLNEPDKAIECLGKALAMLNNEEIDHQLFLANILSSLSQNYLALKKYEESSNYFEVALKKIQSFRNGQDLEIGAIYDKIGGIYAQRKEFENSLEFFQKALKIRQNFFSGQHPELAQSYVLIGTIYDCQNKKEKALQFFKKALEIGIQKLGKQHTLTAINYNSIAIYYLNTKDYNNSIKYFKMVLENKLLLKNDQFALETYQRFGEAYAGLNDMENALEAYQESLQISCQKSYEHLKWRSYNSIGNVYYRNNVHEKALENYNQALICVSLNNQTELATCYSNIGNTYKQLGKLEEAYPYYKKSSDLRLEMPDDQELHLMNLYENMGEIHLKFEQYIKANSFLTKAFKISNQKYGSQHPISQNQMALLKKCAAETINKMNDGIGVCGICCLVSSAICCPCIACYSYYRGSAIEEEETALLSREKPNIQKEEI